MFCESLPLFGLFAASLVVWFGLVLVVKSERLADLTVLTLGMTGVGMTGVGAGVVELSSAPPV